MQRFTKIGKRIFSAVAIPSALMLFASLSVSAMADNVCKLLVTLKNSDEKAFVLSEKPVVTFNATECVIDCNGFTSYFEMSEVKDIKFVDEFIAVGEVLSNQVILDFTDPVTAVVSGVPEGVDVSLYSLDGILLRTSKANGEGVAVLDMSDVTSGSFCIISVNKVKNFKLHKK